MNTCITELLDKQSEIIRIQSDIIDSLSAALMQHEAIAEADLEMIQMAAKMREEVEA